MWYGCVPNGCVSYYFSFSTYTLQEKEKLKLQAFNLLKILIFLSTNKQTNKMITLPPLAAHAHAWGNKILPPFLYFLHLEDDKRVFYFIWPYPYTIGFLLAIEESHINHNSLN